MLFLFFLFSLASSFEYLRRSSREARSLTIGEVRSVRNENFVVETPRTTKRSIQNQNPNDYVCGQTVTSEALWKSKFPTVAAFTGFYRADGCLQILDPNNNVLFTLNLNGSLWHQYFDTNGNLVGDFYLGNLVPGVLVLVSRGMIVTMFSDSKLCQIFVPPTPPNIIASYSEIYPPQLANGFMMTAYMSTAEASLGQTFSTEYFSFDYNFTSAHNRMDTLTNGLGYAGHYVSQSVSFTYTPITQDQATALGWNGNVANFNSTKGIAVGRGVIPVEVLTQSQRQQYGL